MIDKDGNIVEPDYKELMNYAKQFSGLSPDKENKLIELGPLISNEIPQVTERFYDVLTMIPQATPLLEGRIDALKETHTNWMKSIFTGPYDEVYTAQMYHVGDVHVKVNMPVEFMSGGMTLIGNELYKIVCGIYKDDPQQLLDMTVALNAILGFSLFVMQKSYNASVEEELDKFLLITGMSRPLFDKLSSTFSAKKS
ncbi:MAG: protoglobin domain-containing protein [Thiohalomonadales bacterium]